MVESMNKSDRVFIPGGLAVKIKALRLFPKIKSKGVSLSANLVNLWGTF